MPAENTMDATERSKEGSCSETDPPEVALVANVNEAEPTEDPLTVTDITDSIRLLVSITDVEEFADKSYTFGLDVVDCFSTSTQTQTALPNIGGFVNFVRKGVSESKSGGQGNTLCCSHISLMFVHLFHCTEIRDKLTDGTPDGICKNLTHQYQFLIARGK